MSGHIYLGRRYRDGCQVLRRRSPSSALAVPLHPRLDLLDHSPDGFEWGYCGSGPAQLALALLADATGDVATAVRLHRQFKREIVANLDRTGWELSEETILEWVCNAQTPPRE